MRTQSIFLALLLSCSALAWACGDSMPPAASPTAPTAPVTTVVLDAGAPDTTPTPMAVAVAPVASATTTAAADPPDAGATTTPSGDFFSCTTVADCVAVAKNDCCKNGFKEAVNKGSVDAYRASAPACNPKRKCPMFRIMDKRVPACNAGKCTLVQPDAGTP